MNTDRINKILKTFFWVVVVSISLSACDSSGFQFGSSSSSKYDSLFLGFSFGMERREFYDYCWEMNKQKKFMHGTGTTSVQYILENETPKPVIMRFFPSFHDERIYEMPVTFTYEAWAPWNKQYWSDVLLEQMYEVFKKWYGDDFQLIEHPTQGKVYAKIDGHRRINLFIRDDQFVQAVFTDMRVEKKLKEKQQNLSGN